jgi:carbonic anhydrase
VNAIPGIDGFGLYDRALDREIKKLMEFEVDGVIVTLFDYIYTTSGKHSTTYFQSVFLFEPGDQSFPDFTLRPEGAFDKMFSAFGYQDIDFCQRPEFSRQYILRGQDEAAIRQTFNDRLLSFYESNPGTFTDAVDNQLFVYRAHHRLQPEEIESHIELWRQILTLMEQLPVRERNGYPND